MWGALFGLCFPIVATLIECSQFRSDYNFLTLLKCQLDSPLLWIIDSAPLFLGIFAYLIGRQVDVVGEKNREILDTQKRLILQEKMASIGQMTAGIAHEIKNPLNFVINYAESSLDLLQEFREEFNAGNDELSEHKRKLLEEFLYDIEHNTSDIKENGQRANRIVFSLMDQTRSSQGQRKSIQVNELIRDNLKLAFHGYRARHPSFNMEIEFDLDDGLGTIQVDPQSLGRVLINLFNNAFDAMNAKSNGSSGDYQPKIRISTSHHEEYISLFIRDNGEGINNESSKQIFEPFFTTKPSGQGNTGLGLSISLDIIEQEHHGSMHVESEMGQYTQFLIQIPYDQNSTSAGS